MDLREVLVRTLVRGSVVALVFAAGMLWEAWRARRLHGGAAPGAEGEAPSGCVLALASGVGLALVAWGVRVWLRGPFLRHMLAGGEPARSRRWAHPNPPLYRFDEEAVWLWGGAWMVWGVAAFAALRWGLAGRARWLGWSLAAAGWYAGLFLRHWAADLAVRVD